MNQQERIYTMTLTSVYPHYVAKAEKKGRTEAEVRTIIRWLTGYNEEELIQILQNKTNFKDLMDDAPIINPNAHLIKGVICGYRVEDIEDRTVQLVRYLDKMIDELAKGKPLAKILRSPQ